MKYDDDLLKAIDAVPVVSPPTEIPPEPLEPPTFYRLDEQGIEPIPVYGGFDPVFWEESPSRVTVCRQIVAPGVVISTVFLRVDHMFTRSDGPTLWETMVFVSPEADRMVWEEWRGYQQRCGGNRHDALTMHLRVIDLLPITTPLSIFS